MVELCCCCCFVFDRGHTQKNRSPWWGLPKIWSTWKVLSSGCHLASSEPLNPTQGRTVLLVQKMQKGQSIWWWNLCILINLLLITQHLWLEVNHAILVATRRKALLREDIMLSSMYMNNKMLISISWVKHMYCVVQLFGIFFFGLSLSFKLNLKWFPAWTGD